MRTSPCCGAPTAIHGARRRICRRCRTTWTIRPRQRGRKRKRVRTDFAAQVLRSGASLRGLAASRSLSRETLRRRFHRSLATWLRAHPPPSLPGGREPLIAIVDVLWFRTVNHRPAFGCFTVLLRPVKASHAYLAILSLLPGRESKTDWEHTFSQLPDSVRRRIVAVIADGFTGLITLAKRYGWHFQWCHVHMKRRIAELRGVRRLPGQAIRQEVYALVYEFLETPSEKCAARCQERIKALFHDPNCPTSIVRRLSGIVKRGKYLRTYRTYPSLNLPVSTNSVEYVHRQIRERFRQMRGVNSVTTLRQWIMVIHHRIRGVTCRGYKETISAKDHRKSVS